MSVCLSVSVQNGYLEATEVAQWVLPTEVDHADNEAKHLIHETDTNKVGSPALLSSPLLPRPYGRWARSDKIHLMNP